MAFIVFISLPMPLSAEKFPVKELPLRKASLAILSRQATVETATNLLAHCCSNGEIFSVSNCRGYLTSLHHFGELVSCCKSGHQQALKYCEQVMKLDTAIPWSEFMEAALIEIIPSQEMHHPVLC